MKIKQLLASVSSLALALAPIAGHANPSGGSVVAGDAVIQQTNPTTVTIQQNSNQAIIDWQDFSIDAGETTIFNQPNSGSVALNRVTGGQVSQILGTLQANGQVFLINPNGVVFSQSAQVDVSGLVATTSNIDNTDFMNQQYNFDQAGLSSAEIINAGTITAADGGLVALVAPIVKNSGLITARLGQVTLAGGETFTLDLYGDQLVALSVEDNSLDNSLAENTGTISAAGGYIALTAGQATQALDNIVNMEGYIHADTIDTNNGRIVLGSSNGFTEINGTITANGEDAGENGGVVEIIAQRLALRSETDIQANGDTNGGNINVGGSFQGQGPLPNAKRTLVEEGATLQANSTNNGDGGQVIVWADEITGFAGHIEATGGTNGGDGGFVEVSGKDTLIFNGTVDTTAAQGEMGTLLLDPANITIHDGSGQADDAQVSDGEILTADGGSGDFDIAEVALEALAAGTNITLEATNDITINDLTDDTLGLATTGDVIFRADSDSDGSGDFTMNTGDTIQTDGANISFNGANVTVGGIDTSSSADGNVTFSASTGTTMYGNISTNDGNWIINGTSTLGNNVTYSTGSGTGNIIFSSAVSGDYTLNLDVGATGNITARDVDVDTITFTSGNNFTLNGTLEADNAISFTPLNGIMTITGNSAIYARDGAAERNITFPATMTMNGAYTMDMIGNTITLQEIGNSNPLSSISVVGDSLIDIGNNITTVGTQTYTGATSIGGNLTTTDSDVAVTAAITVPTSFAINTGSGGGDITLGSTIDGGFNVTLSAGTGNITVGGAVGATTPIAQMTASGSTLDFSNGVISTDDQSYSGPITIGGTFSTTNDDIDFNSAVTLAAHTTLGTSTGAGDITFNSTVDGGYDLTADAGTGITQFNGNVGATTPLEDIDVSGNSVAVNTMVSTGSQQYTGALSLNGDLTVTAGGLTLSGDVTLAGDSTLTSGGGVADTLDVSGNITGDYILTLIAGSGDISLGNIDVDTLTLTSGDDLTIGNTITTDTAQDYTNVDDLNISGSATFTAGDSGTRQDITFDADNAITTSGNVTMLGDTITLYSLTGAQQLAITGDTAVTLNNDLTSTDTMTLGGGTVNLGGILTTTNADMTINSTLTLTADSTLTTGAGGGGITLGSTVDGGYNLTINAGTGDFTATSGDIGGTTALTSLDVTANDIAVANVTTTGAQDYTGNVTGSGLLSGGSAINMTGDVVLGGGVTTSNGDVSINGDVTLTADSILQSGGTSADTITINGDINGDYDLDFAAGSANITISGNMDIDQWILTSGNNLTLGSGTFTTDNAMDFSNVGNITLSADTTFTANDGSNPADITMGANNDITGPYNLIFNGDNITLYGIGEENNMSNSPLSLTVNATAFNLLGAVYTQNEQTYSSLDGLASDLVTNGADITLNTDLVLQGDVMISTGSNSGGNVSFGGPIDGAYNLAIEAGTGNITTSGNFGDTTPLTSLSLSGSNFDLYNVTTTGNQTYTGDTTLNGDLTSSGGAITFNDTITLASNIAIDSDTTLGGDLTFNDNIDGAFDFTLTAGTGDIIFNGALGTGTRLGTLTLNTLDSMTMAQGARVTRFVQSGATGETVIFGSNPGLDSLEGIFISSPSYIAGRLVSDEINVASSGTMDIEVLTQNLTIGGEGSNITGTIEGYGGYQAARRVNFNSITGGPHNINGYNIPLLDDITAPQILNTTGLNDADSQIAVTANATPNSARELNPFSGSYQLVTADETGILSSDYLTGTLWEDDDRAISPSSEEDDAEL